MAEPDIEPGTASIGEQLLVFVAEGHRYAVAIEAVQEIVPYRVATRLPGAPSHVVGLINLRGRLVTVTDLAVQLGSRTAGGERPEGGSIILVESGARTVGMMVDEVRDVRPIVPGTVEPIQRDEATPGMLQSLARFGDGVAVVLDPNALVAHVLQ
jgi:purine-binding chemotaxis protein CheW